VVHNGVIDANKGTVSLLGAGTIISNGLIQASAGGKLNVSANVDGTGSWRTDGGTLHVGTASVTTTGNITVKNSGRLELVGGTMTGANLTIDSSSSLSVSSKIDILRNFSFAMKDESKWSWSTSAILEMDGGQYASIGDWTNWGSLEVGCIDFGTNPDTHLGALTGFSGNFHLENLDLSGSARVCLVDLLDNGNRIDKGWGTNEALYVHNLTLGDDSILNLNGLHLFYNTLSGNGQIINQAVPEPATIILITTAMLSLLAFWGKRSLSKTRSS
jgi:hypothetical protein